MSTYYTNGWGYNTTSTVTINGGSLNNQPYTWVTGTYQITGGDTVAIKAKHWLVVKRGNSSPTEVCDSQKEAVAAAKRLAAKVGDEFFVFKNVAIVRPVPVEVEVEEV